MYVLLAKQKHNTENRGNFKQKIPAYSNPKSISNSFTTMKRKPAFSFEEKVKMHTLSTFNAGGAKMLWIKHEPQKKRKTPSKHL